MKSARVVAVLLCALVAGTASAQYWGVFQSPRSQAMGTAAIAVTDDATAWALNPAGLGMPSSASKTDREWYSDVIASYAYAGGSFEEVDWSGWSSSKSFGVGAGYLRGLDDTNSYGAGVGCGVGSLPLSAGVNAWHSDGQTTCDLGLLYRFDRKTGAPVRVGLLLEDITNQQPGAGVVWDIGVAWMATPRLLLAIDGIDMSNTTRDIDAPGGPYYDVGAEYSLGKSGDWKLRGGINSWATKRMLCLGAGCRLGSGWRLDAAWVNAGVDPADPTWAISAGRSF